MKMERGEQIYEAVSVGASERKRSCERDRLLSLLVEDLFIFLEKMDQISPDADEEQA